MHVTTPLNELITSLGMLGWEFKGLKVKNGAYVASAKNPQSGQDIERTGNSPEMAVHAVFQYAQRANTIRAFATRQIDKNLVQSGRGNYGWHTQAQEEGDPYPIPGDGGGDQAQAQEAVRSPQEDVDWQNLWWPTAEHAADIWNQVADREGEGWVPAEMGQAPDIWGGQIGNTQMLAAYGQFRDIYDAAATMIDKVQRLQAAPTANKRTGSFLGLTFLENNGIDTTPLAEDPALLEEYIRLVNGLSDSSEYRTTTEELASFFRNYFTSNLGQQNTGWWDEFQYGDPDVLPTRRSAWGTNPAPQIHVFDDTYDDTGWVYNMTQTDDSIKDGDVLVVPSEQVVGVMVQAWPTAVTENTGQFHGLDPEYVESGGQPTLEGGSESAWASLDGGRYMQSYERAKREAEKLGWRLAAEDPKQSEEAIQKMLATPIPCTTDLGQPVGQFYVPVPGQTTGPAEEKQEQGAPVTAALGEAEEPLYVPENIMEEIPQDLQDVEKTEEGVKIVNKPPMGVRVLVVHPEGDTVTLHSPTYDTEWPTNGQWLQAHMKPERNSNHGINIVMEEYKRILEDYKQKPWVEAVVEAAGAIWKYQEGYRAEYAKPYSIKVPANVTWYGKWTSEDIAKMLRKNYLVDVTVVEMNADMYDIAGWSFIEQEYDLDDPEGWSYSVNRGGQRQRTIVVKDEDGADRAYIDARADGPDLSVQSIIDLNGQPLNNRGDPEATEAVSKVIEILSEQSTIGWDQSAEQGRDNDQYDTEVDWDSQETMSIESIEDLIKTWNEIQERPDQFTEFTHGEGYNDRKLVQESDEGGPYLDDFGLAVWFEVITEYPPTAINFSAQEFQEILKQAVDFIANDNFQGQHIDEQMLDELAQALYGVPTFMASSDYSHGEFEPNTLEKFFDNEIQWGINYASEVIGRSVFQQEETLFPTDYYGQPVGLGMHPKLNRFFNLLRYYVQEGQRVHQPTKMSPNPWTTWEDSPTPEWGAREVAEAVPGTFSKWILKG